MGEVRSIDPLELVTADGEHFAVSEPAGRPSSEVIDRDHRRSSAAERYGLRGDGQKLIERAAFIRFEMREADVSEFRDRDHVLDRFANEREHRPRPAVKHEWRFAGDQILIE